MKSAVINMVYALGAGLLLGGVAQAADPVAVRQAVPTAKIVRISPALDAVLAPGATIEKVATGFVFTEGPMWHQGAVWFSDLSGNRMYSLSSDGKLKMLLDKAGGTPGFAPGAYKGSNAMAAMKDGSVLMMQHGARRIVRLDDKLNVKVYLAKYQGQQLNSPNDLVYAADGTLYFTDPPFGFFDPSAPDKDPDKDPGHVLKFNGVYRYKDGKLTAVITDLPRPNGVTLSVDGKTLYIANSGGPAAVYSYEVKADGSLANRQVVIDLSKETGEGVPDGIKIDSLGNIWVSGPGGFRILSPKGQVLGQIVLPEVASNLAWGGDDGKTAYFTGSTSIYRLPLKVPGHLPAYR